MVKGLAGFVLLLGLSSCTSNFDLALKNAEAGSIDHQLRVSKMYLRGDGVSPSEGRAFYWAYKAAIRGNADAQYEVARFYYRNRFYDTTSIDGFAELTAMSYLSSLWLVKAANQGHGEAIALLSEFYLTGTGMPKNPEAAYKLLAQHAPEGHPAVLYRLGLLYLDGKGVGQDVAKGLDLLAKASNKGYSPASSEYCYLIEEGKFLRFDAKAAFACYLNVATKDPTLGSNVAGRYAFGHGVGQDSVLAHAWYLLEMKYSGGDIHPNDAYKFSIVEKRLGLLDKLESRYLVLRWTPGEEIHRIR